MWLFNNKWEGDGDGDSHKNVDGDEANISSSSTIKTEEVTNSSDICISTCTSSLDNLGVDEYEDKVEDEDKDENEDEVENEAKLYFSLMIKTEEVFDSIDTLISTCTSSLDNNVLDKDKDEATPYSSSMIKTECKQFLVFVIFLLVHILVVWVAAAVWPVLL